MESLVAALVVGLLQGLLEWLPISSQGNLVMVMMTLLGLEPTYALSMSVYLHIGTGLAALAYFREEIVGVLRQDSLKDQLLLRFLSIVTFVTGVVGLPLFLIARGASLYGEVLLVLTGFALVVTGLVQKGAQRGGGRTAESLETMEGVVLGVVQGLSAIPGLSRSGLTTSVLLFRRFSGEEAFQISFLMSIPAVFGAALGLMYLEGVPVMEPTLIVSLTASFISAYISIDALLRLARSIKFWGLCIILGLLAILPQVLNLF